MTCTVCIKISSNDSININGRSSRGMLHLITTFLFLPWTKSAEAQKNANKSHKDLNWMIAEATVLYLLFSEDLI
jgi:hypothetical protein